MDLFVSADWLSDNLDRVAVLDTSFYLPGSGKDPEREFTKARIPGAQRWDIDAISSTLPEHKGLPHMMPAPEQIAAAAGVRGIDRNTPVVVYDQIGVFSAPRVWFTFAGIGHPEIYILKGGFPAWCSGGGRGTGFERATGPVSPVAPRVYGPVEADQRFKTCDLAFMKANLDTKISQVLDARPLDRFSGEAPEPRAGLKSGHIPDSKSLPFSVLLQDGELLPEAALKAVFDELGVDLSRPVTTSCGSGVAAAVVSMALWKLGVSATLFDGSWSQWGLPEQGLPVETGVPGAKHP